MKKQKTVQMKRKREKVFTGHEYTKYLQLQRQERLFAGEKEKKGEAATKHGENESTTSHKVSRPSVSSHYVAGLRLSAESVFL